MKQFLLVILAVSALTACLYLVPREEESSAVLTVPAQLYIEQTEVPQTQPPETIPETHTQTAPPETQAPVPATANTEAAGITLAEVQDQITLADAELETRAVSEPSALPVSLYCQYPDYPTGCECAALYMLLRFYGTDVTMEQLANAIPKGSAPYEAEDGTMYGADPEKVFVGDPRNSYSYGVFNEPIAQTANQFRDGAVSRTGVSLEAALDIVDTGHPVIAWYTTNPETGIVYRRSWRDEQTGEKITWPGNEHAVVITWHDDTSLSYNDSSTGKSVTVGIEKFREIFDELGGRIVCYEK